MMRGNQLKCASLVAVLMFSNISYSSANAQDEDQQNIYVQQMFGANIRSIFCETAGAAATAFAPRVGGVVTQILENTSVCQTPPETEPNPTPMPVRIGLQLQIIHVQNPTSEDITFANAGPDTVFGTGDGFFFNLAANVPGYLQIWSTDDANREMRQGFLVGENGLDIVAYPRGPIEPGASRSYAYYPFEDAVGNTNLELRFLPCTHGVPQMFGLPQGSPEAHRFEQVAEQYAADLSTLRDSIADNTCSVPSVTSENNYLFLNAESIDVHYDDQSGIYSAFPESEGPFIVSITLLRQ